MFNFTGQTKRRNVNLGTNRTTSRQELVANARKESERRAEERLETTSAVRIQSSIRSYLDLKLFLKSLLHNADTSKINVPKIILAFGPKLFKFLQVSELKTLLETASPILKQYGNQFGNKQLCRLIEQSNTDEIFECIISCMNFNYPIGPKFLYSLCHYLNQATYIQGPSCDALCIVIENWALQDTHEFSKLLELNYKDESSSKNLQNFLISLAKYKIIPKHPSEGYTFLENLSFIYFHDYENDKLIKVIAECFNVIILESFHENMIRYLNEIFERRFCTKLMALFDDPEVTDINLGTVRKYLLCAKSIKSGDAITVCLLSKQNYMTALFDTLQVDQKNNQNVTPENLSLFIQLLETYLLVATDQELLNESRIISAKNLVKFCLYLKEFVFNKLWKASFDCDEILFEESLMLLRNLYFRDSRLKFCSKGNPNFWRSDDKEFLEVAIFIHLDDYEKLYREFLEEHDTSQMMTNDLQPNNSALDKFRIFEAFKLKKNTIVSTRQFRKLEILIKAPFLIPFDQRVELFYTFIAIDKHRLSLDSDYNMNDNFSIWSMGLNEQKESITISREHVLEDAYEAFNNIGERIKSKLAVTFTNEFGPEAGIDGGGITKEFLTSVSEEGFKNKKYELFDNNEKYELYPRPYANLEKLKFFSFLGKIVGKCLYDRVLIDVEFADFFIKKLLNYSNNFRSTFDDLLSFDETLYQNLVKLLKMSSEQIEALDLTFEITDERDTNKTIELIKNKSNVKVTKANVLQYILLVSDMKLNQHEYAQTSYFHAGLSTIIAPHWMEMFNSIELQMLISGGDKDINLEDLKANTVYGGFQPTDKTIIDLWEILEEFEVQDRLNFVKFVTSVPRGPLKGFASLNPKFGIRNAGKSTERLPTASTCVNLLKLPDYEDKSVLKDKLLYAINSGARFDLS